MAAATPDRTTPTVEPTPPPTVTSGAAEPRTLRLYRRATRLPLGTHLFSQAFRFAAPYFRSIPAVVELVEPGRAEARMAHRFWVRNHLGTVHAISLCNLAELTMGCAAEATVPTTHRWVPRGMAVTYDALARGTMHAVCTVTLPEDLDRTSVPFEVVVTDDDGQVVFTATIDIWITRRKDA